MRDGLYDPDAAGRVLLGHGISDPAYIWRGCDHIVGYAIYMELYVQPEKFVYG